MDVAIHFYLLLVAVQFTYIEARLGADMSATRGVKVSSEEQELINWYAAQKHRSISELFRLSLLDEIERRYDRELYVKAKSEYEADPQTVSHQELLEKYGM